MFCNAVKQHFLLVYWVCVCVCRVHFVAHYVLFLFAPMLFSHRDWTFSVVMAQIYHISQLPSPSPLPPWPQLGTIYHTARSRSRAQCQSHLCPAWKGSQARHISVAAAQERRLGSWHAVCESRLPSTVPAVSFCHLQKESQMLWHDKAARLARRSGYMGETKGEGVPPFCPRHAINEFLWRDTVSRSANLSRDLKIYRHKYDVICIFFFF